MDTGKSPRLLDRVRDRCRTKHCSYRTEQSYIHWIRRFILFHGKRHPDQMGVGDSEPECRTRQSYTHVLNSGGRGMLDPLASFSSSIPSLVTAPDVRESAIFLCRYSKI